MIRLALRSALSDRAALGRVALVNGFDWETPKTKVALEALSALGLEGSILIVCGLEDDVATRSFRNLPNVHTIASAELNAYDVIRAEWVLFTDETLPTSAAKEEVA